MICCVVLAEREQSGLRRRIASLKILDSIHLEYEGRRYVNFASNDYLGLSDHPRVIAAGARFVSMALERGQRG